MAEFESRAQSKGSRTDVVGNFFAPFFDVVFYRQVEEPGIVQAVPAEVNGADTINAVLGLQKSVYDNNLAGAKSAADFGLNATIGASRVKLTNAGGNSTLFEPDSELADLRNFKSSLTIEARASTAVKATLVFQPPYLEGLKIVDNQLIKFGSLMEIQWGYLNADGGEPVLSNKGLFGIVQPSVKLSNQFSIEINGWDLLYMSSSSVDRRFSWPREQYDTDLKIVEKLNSLSVGESYRLNTDMVSIESPLRQKKEGETVVQTTDDFSFFKELLAANDVEYRIDGNIVRLFDAGRADQQEPAYSLLWYKQPEKNTDIPMITFETNSIASLFAGQGSRGFWFMSQDMDSNTTERQEVKPEDTGVSQTGSKALGTQEAGHPKGTVRTSEANVKPYSMPDDSSATGQVHVQPRDTPNRDTKADRKGREVRRLCNTTASATIPGHPGIVPLTIVNVFGDESAGVGRTFGGNYRVMKAIHEIGQGYVTKIELLRASTSGDDRATEEKSSDKTNTNKTTAASGEEVAPRPENESSIADAQEGG